MYEPFVIVGVVILISGIIVWSMVFYEVWKYRKEISHLERERIYKKKR